MRDWLEYLHNLTSSNKIGLIGDTSLGDVISKHKYGNVQGCPNLLPTSLEHYYNAYVSPLWPTELESIFLDLQIFQTISLASSYKGILFCHQQAYESPARSRHTTSSYMRTHLEGYPSVAGCIFEIRKWWYHFIILPASGSCYRAWLDFFLLSILPLSLFARLLRASGLSRPTYMDRGGVLTDGTIWDERGRTILLPLLHSIFSYVYVIYFLRTAAGPNKAGKGK